MSYGSDTIDMRDWPERLRINAASIRLAHALHEARREAFIASMMAFDELPTHIRWAYIETAQQLLTATSPRVGLPDDVQIGPQDWRANGR